MQVKTAKLIFGDCNPGKVRQTKPAQLAFRRTINIILLTYLLKGGHGDIISEKSVFLFATPLLSSLRLEANFDI